jgi:hypothetical protein
MGILALGWDVLLCRASRALLDILKEEKRTIILTAATLTSISMAILLLHNSTVSELFPTCLSFCGGRGLTRTSLRFIGNSAECRGESS